MPAARPSRGLRVDAAVQEAAAREPITNPSDLWLLGALLLCGDSTSKEDVARLFNGNLAGLIATDLPYLVCFTFDTFDATHTF